MRSRGKSWKEIARALGRSADSVRYKLNSGIEPVEAAPTTAIEDLQRQDEVYWKSQHSVLAQKYSKLVKEVNVVDRLVGEVHGMAPLSYSPAPSVASVRKSSGRPQSAVLALSDTHIGATVTADQTLTFGSYDFPTFLARLKFLEESVVSIATNHITTEVPELVIPMLGDMLDGALQHSNECGQMNPMFNQCFNGAHAMAQFLRNLSRAFPVVRVYDVVGNHPRFQNQKKMPAKNKHSNFDKFFYALTQALVRDIKNIQWTLTAQPFQEFEVNGFQFFAGHGETLRGGDKALGIPNHAIGRMVSTTTQLFNKYDKKAPNYYLFGHLHRNISLPHATGDVIINGGFVGVDGYGLSENFTPADPMQKLFFVHETYGKTATYDIGLKWAEKTKDSPYLLPAGFSMV